MNERFDRELELIRQLEDEPVPPGLRDRLMADASTAAALRRSSPAWNPGLTLKRLTLAAGFSIVLLIMSVNSLGYACASAL